MVECRSETIVRQLLWTHEVPLVPSAFLLSYDSDEFLGLLGVDMCFLTLVLFSSLTVLQSSSCVDQGAFPGGALVVPSVTVLLSVGPWPMIASTGADRQEVVSDGLCNH